MDQPLMVAGEASPILMAEKSVGFLEIVSLALINTPSLPVERFHVS
jgi:hypothetical protein